MYQSYIKVPENIQFFALLKTHHFTTDLGLKMLKNRAKKEINFLKKSKISFLRSNKIKFFLKKIDKILKNQIFEKKSRLMRCEAKGSFFEKNEEAPHLRLLTTPTR